MPVMLAVCVVATAYTSSPGKKDRPGATVTTLPAALCVAVTNPCIIECTATVWLVTVVALTGWV